MVRKDVKARKELKGRLLRLARAGSQGILLATAVLGSTPLEARVTPPQAKTSLQDRIASAQQQSADQQTTFDAHDPNLKPAWWGNWHNGWWHPWGNWHNWHNWHNWGNW